MVTGDGSGKGPISSGLDPDGDPFAAAALGLDVQSRIGEQLRAMYDGLMDQPVPDRFRALLARLERSGEAEETG